MSDTRTEPAEDTVAWDELRPPCTHGKMNQKTRCGAPATWWHTCTGCGGVTFLCDTHHGLLVTDQGRWLHISGCGRSWRPAIAAVRAMGRL